MEEDRKREERDGMCRVQKIYEHPEFGQCLKKNRIAEENREFCVHDMNHFLDVARLAYIFSMERGYGISKEEIYAAALLHDIGKWQQYAEKIPHEKASAGIAEGILADAGFEKEERGRILEAILNHRQEGEASYGKLAEILYDADKMSRSCFSCQAREACNWSDRKKNLQIMW